MGGNGEMDHIVNLTKAVGELRGEVTTGMANLNIQLSGIVSRQARIDTEGCALGSSNSKRIALLENRRYNGNGNGNGSNDNGDGTGKGMTVKFWPPSIEGIPYSRAGMIGRGIVLAGVAWALVKAHLNGGTQ